MTIRVKFGRFRKLLGIAAVAAVSGAGATAQTHIGNVVIDGSLCVGNDCPASVSFGFDTIVMKENNLRVFFDDTSTAASFPRNDWRLTANDSANGGSSYLAIEDATAGRRAFVVEAGARSNALFVEDDGDIGIGTATPALDVTVVTGNTPSLRLQQDGSSGFAPQTWDVAGNETNFFIRDATNGSTLPLRIRPGASSNVIVIDDDDDVGLGVVEATAALHVKRSNGTAKLYVEEASGTAGHRTLLHLSNSGVTQMTIENTNSPGAWNVQAVNSGDLRFAHPSTAGVEMTLTDAGALAILGTLTTGGGTCGGGCDAVFTEEYELPTIADHAAEMFALGYLPNVGPTVENAPINVSDKLGRMLNELEHAHIYIATLNAEMAEMRTELRDLRGRLGVTE